MPRMLIILPGLVVGRIVGGRVHPRLSNRYYDFWIIQMAVGWNLPCMLNYYYYLFVADDEAYYYHYYYLRHHYCCYNHYSHDHSHRHHTDQSMFVEFRMRV